MRLAFPPRDTEKIQPDRGVRVGEYARDPRVGGLDVNSELLVQLAKQRVRAILARLDLAAWEFPVSGVDLAERALRQQECAIRPLHHGRRDLDHHFFFGCRPTQSRANW